jgi:ATP-dependent DNA helicase PIF1
MNGQSPKIQVKQNSLDAFIISSTKRKSLRENSVERVPSQPALKRKSFQRSGWANSSSGFEDDALLVDLTAEYPKVLGFAQNPRGNAFHDQVVDLTEGAQSSYSTCNDAEEDDDEFAVMGTVKLPSRSLTDCSEPSLASKKKRPVPWDLSVNTRPATRAGSQDKRKSTAIIDEFCLSDEQQRVLDMAMSGTSLFFTGAAGTGKSFLLKKIIVQLTTQHGLENVGVTASTGLAAFNIGGQTLHRWAGIGLGLGSVEVLAKNISNGRSKGSKEAFKRWQTAKVLVIDEISMIHGDLLDKLESLARKLRSSKLPFGGIQVVLTGDFFQLPPVPDKNNRGKDGKPKKPTLCFGAKSWPTVIRRQVLLTRIFRQQGDNKLINMLSAMRLGKLTAEIIREFQALSRQVNYHDGIMPTRLFPTKRQVAFANAEEMNKLPGRLFRFQASETGSVDSEQRSKLLENVMAVQLLELKIGAQVLMIKNIDDYIFNGSPGRLISLVTSTNEWLQIQPHVELYNLVLNNGGIVPTADAQRELDALDPEVQKCLLSGAKSDPSFLRPVVSFVVPGGTLVRVVDIAEFSVETPPPDAKVLAARHQFPLILSWAMSIHKAQGQTLDRVVVDLGEAFEVGQAYVAVSRATCADRLQVLRFKESVVKVDPTVIEFYNRLESQ